MSQRVIKHAGRKRGAWRLDAKRVCIGALLLCVFGWGSWSARRQAAERESCEQRMSALGQRAPRWSPEQSAACGAGQRTAALGLISVLERFPELPTPDVRVDRGVRVDSSAELEVRSGTLLIQPASPALADPSVWLHELAHLQARGARPTEKIAVRILRAFEEGVADYYAASLNQQPKLGVTEGRAVRDLSQPQAAPASTWPALALGSADPHRFGAALAAELWRSHGADALLAQDLVLGLGQMGPAELAAVRGVQALSVALRATPSRSRARLLAVLQRWLPEELHPGLGQALHPTSTDTRWAQGGVR